jgi:glycosyltransferase involved in cell wall biosynthesis
VQQIVGELERRGHEIERAVIDRRGRSEARSAALAGRALAAARRFRPDVVYAHFLFPAGAIGALAARAASAPLVVTAHGQDVRNVGTMRGAGPATRFALARSAAVIAVSDYLRRELSRRVPALETDVEVINCGVDLERFRPQDGGALREKLGWRGEPPFYLTVGGLSPRKNVIRVAEAWARLGRGSLAFVGDGALRSELEGRPGVTVVGAVPHERVGDWIGACDVLCQPSLVEPFGQALLEAMASERPVVATRVGGPPEFVTPEAGVLVDPESLESISAGMAAAAQLPIPNPAGRAAAAAHDVRLQAERIERVLAEATAAAQ